MMVDTELIMMTLEAKHYQDLFYGTGERICNCIERRDFDRAIELLGVQNDYLEKYYAIKNKLAELES